MKGGVNQGAVFSYWRLSYRRKFIRTLWLTAVVVPVLLALQVNVSIIGVVVALGIVQACHTYYRWRREVANSGDGTAAPRAQPPLAHSTAEADRITAKPKMSP